MCCDRVPETLGRSLEEASNEQAPETSTTEVAPAKENGWNKDSSSPVALVGVKVDSDGNTDTVRWHRQA